MLVVTDVLEEVATCVFIAEAPFHPEDYSLNLLLSEDVKSYIFIAEQ
jgi:hypothetical protein